MLVLDSGTRLSASDVHSALKHFYRHGALPKPDNPKPPRLSFGKKPKT